MSRTVITNLQRKIGVKPDGVFGPKTAKAFAAHFGLITTEAAHLLGQCHHESGGFRLMEENLNYSAARLLQIFPRYFTGPSEAALYANNPVSIANRVYANRMGNGAESSGDGFRHRGFGPLQLTGKTNQSRFMASVGRSLQEVHLIREELAFESAIWFFRENRIFQHCKNVSQGAILTVSRAVNIGNPNSQAIPHGLDDRIIQTLHYFNLLTR